MRRWSRGSLGSGGSNSRSFNPIPAPPDRFGMSSDPDVVQDPRYLEYRAARDSAYALQQRRLRECLLAAGFKLEPADR